MVMDTVILSEAKDLRISFESNTEMLRFAQHDGQRFFYSFLSLSARQVAEPHNSLR